MDTQSQILEVMNPSAIEQQQRAEVDVQIATAKRYPRSLSKVKQDMLSFATLDTETAEGCFYSLPRGGKTIKGPSVRLAEIAVSTYGNLRAGSRVLSVDTSSDNPHVVIQAVAHDLEKNVAITMEKRRRITKKKSKEFIDEDDINLAANAGSAIAFRDAVFKVVPLALVKPVYEAAMRVAIGDAKTLSERRNAAVERFSKMGVDKARLLEALGKKSIEDVDLGDLETLIGLFNAIKDGETTIEHALAAMRPDKGEAAEVPITMFAKSREAAPKPASSPAKAPALAPSSPSPESRAGATSASPTTLSPQEQLDAWLFEAGIRFDPLKEWMRKKNWTDAKCNETKSMSKKSCEQILRAKEDILKEIMEA